MQLIKCLYSFIMTYKTNIDKMLGIKFTYFSSASKLCVLRRPTSWADSVGFLGGVPVGDVTFRTELSFSPIPLRKVFNKYTPSIS